MKNTRDLKLGEHYRETKSGKVVQLVTIDKSGFKKHSTVRLIVEDVEHPKWRRILRSPSRLVEL